MYGLGRMILSRFMPDTMKKRIFAMLLSALLVANISACVYVPENGIEDRTSETETSTESLDTNDTQSPSLESETNNETVRDVPCLGQLKLFTSRNLTTASIWTDQKGEYYQLYTGNTELE